MPALVIPIPIPGSAAGLTQLHDPAVQILGPNDMRVLGVQQMPGIPGIPRQHLRQYLWQHPRQEPPMRRGQERPISTPERRNAPGVLSTTLENIEVTFSLNALSSG